MVSKHIDLRVSPSEAVFGGLPGRLEAKVCGNELLLPPDTYHRLRNNLGSLHHATDLFLFFEHAPEDVAYVLGWAPQHVYLAHWYLADLLQHHLPKEQISYPPRMAGPLPDLNRDLTGGRSIQ